MARSAQVFFLAPVSRESGLTSMALGLVQALLRDHVAVGYIKPITQPASRGTDDLSAHFARLLLRLEVPEPIPFEVAEERLGSAAGVGQVLRPRQPSLRDVQALQKGGDHLDEFVEHHLCVLAHFGQGVRPHTQQQRLVRLTRGVDPEIGEGARGQQPAQPVEGLRANRLTVDEVGVFGGLRVLLSQPVGEDR